ncbi:MAG: glycosyltransferase, partial [Saprospiraceae bacterium]|nr:glycosyltransferase [Saprospiraceae bacterium]
MPALSVVIPTYQRSESLEKLVDCLVDQTIWDDMEVIVIDQNEPGYLTDVIPHAILKEVRLARSERPNVSLARNLGYEMSRAEVVLFIDDDLEPAREFCRSGL